MNSGYLSGRYSSKGINATPTIYNTIKTNKRNELFIKILIFFHKFLNSVNYTQRYASPRVSYFSNYTGSQTFYCSDNSRRNISCINISNPLCNLLSHCTSSLCSNSPHCRSNTGISNIIFRKTTVRQITV